MAACTLTVCRRQYSGTYCQKRSKYCDCMWLTVKIEAYTVTIYGLQSEYQNRGMFCDCLWLTISTEACTVADSDCMLLTVKIETYTVTVCS